MNTQTQTDKTCSENESAFQCMVKMDLVLEEIRLEVINLTTYIKETA